jgi:hypothetical protein
MSIITAGTFHAMCPIAAKGANPDNTILPGATAPGIAHVANAGVGLVNLTLDQEADATQCIVTATPRSGVADASCQVVHISDAVKQVQTFAAGVLSDAVGFDVVVLRLPG